MNKDQAPSADGESIPRSVSQSGESPTEDRRITVELTETECVMVQHALLTTVCWNRQEGDHDLARRHDEIRGKFIDSHERSLNTDTERGNSE